MAEVGNVVDLVEMLLDKGCDDVITVISFPVVVGFIVEIPSVETEIFTVVFGFGASVVLTALVVVASIESVDSAVLVDSDEGVDI